MVRLGISPSERDAIHQVLLTSKDFISATEFNKAKEHAVELLEKTWIRYLKEDMKTFIEYISLTVITFVNGIEH